MKRIYKSQAYHKAVITNRGKDAIQDQIALSTKYQQLTLALIALVGGDNRPSWMKTPEENEAHRKAIDAKWPNREEQKVMDEDEFIRAVCVRARRIMGDMSAKVCITNVRPLFTSQPTEEQLHNAAKVAVDDTYFHNN